MDDDRQVTDEDVRAAREAWLLARDSQRDPALVRGLFAECERLVATLGRQTAERAGGRRLA